MRQLTVTADQFDTFLFPHVAQSSAKDESEFETALRLMRKIKDPAVTEEVPLTAVERQAKENGQRLFPFRRLLGDAHTFVLEEDEHKLLLKRLNERKTSVALLALEEFDELLKVVAAAPEFKVEAPVAPVGA